MERVVGDHVSLFQRAIPCDVTLTQDFTCGLFINRVVTPNTRQSLPCGHTTNSHAIAPCPYTKVCSNHTGTSRDIREISIASPFLLVCDSQHCVCADFITQINIAHAKLKCVRLLLERIYARLIALSNRMVSWTRALSIILPSIPAI